MLFWKEASVMWFVLTICGWEPVGSSSVSLSPKYFVFLEKRCALQCDLISSFNSNYLHPARCFPWPLASACSTVMSGAFSDGHSKYLCALLTSSCLHCDLKESQEQTQGVVSRLNWLGGEKKGRKKNWHTSFPILPLLYCFFRLQ